MLTLLQELLDQLDRGQPVAYTALVETRGSTPQKPGAVMLVFPDGSQIGTLGGGCVEAEVKRRALQLLDTGSAEILTFQLDSDYGWDDGLICGGRMKMLVDPLRPAEMDQEQRSYYRELHEVVKAGRGCTEAVILDPDKAGGGQPADRFLLDEQGRFITRLGSGELPPQLREQVKPLVRRPRPYVLEGISYLPHLRRCRLVIVGAGHVGQKVGELAAAVDFDVWVVDDRSDYCSPERFPKAKRLIVADLDTALSGLELDSDTFCIIVTRGHNHDEEALYHLAETPAGYVGLIGSKRKIKLIYADLLAEGISPEALRRVQAPLGIDIGSQSVPEIAVSIVAELVAFRNLGSLPDAYARPHLLDEVHPARSASSPES